MQRRRAVQLCWLLAAMSLWGCGQAVTEVAAPEPRPAATPARPPTPARSPAEPAAPVAHVNGVAIDANAVRTEMVRRGADFLSRFERLEEKQGAVEALVRVQVLAQTAREAGYEDLPSLRAAIDRLLAEHYWREEVAALDVPPVSDAEALAEYEANLERYTETLRARGAVLQLRAPSSASRAERAALRARAQELRRQATATDATGATGSGPGPGGRGQRPQQHHRGGPCAAAPGTRRPRTSRAALSE